MQDSPTYEWPSKIVSGNPAKGRRGRALVSVLGHPLCMDKEVHRLRCCDELLSWMVRNLKEKVGKPVTRGSGRMSCGWTYGSKHKLWGSLYSTSMLTTEYCGIF